MDTLHILAFAAGAVIGAAGIWLFLRSGTARVESETEGRFSAELASRDARLAAREEKVQELAENLSARAEENSGLRDELAREKAERASLSTLLNEERKAAHEKLELVNDARAKLMDAFKALSAEALKSNNESFLELARTHLEKFQVEAKKDLESRQKEITEAVNPVRDSLAQVDHKLQAMEKERVSSYAGLNEQVKNLALTQNRLRDETSRLVRALRTPNVRGRWGEIQLKRVVEIAGMLPYCDFDEQISVTADDARLRPDLIVRLPGGKNIVVDAKAPLEAYLNALDCEEDSEKNAHLLSHSRQIRDHMVKLSSKAYWDQFQPTPDFVIMFLPGETFFSAALEQNPHIIEEGVNQRVILASPTTLIALLRAVAYGWQQEKLTESAEEISNLGKELFNRLCVFTEHLEKLGNSLEGAVSNYNKAVGSFDSRVLVTARQFPDLGLSSNKEVPYLKQVEKAPREISAADTAD